jgi:signal transduction histidine kinase
VYTESPHYLGVLVQMCEALNSSNERWEGYVKAVGILQRTVGARLAPSFLLDGSGDRAVLVTDEEQRAILGERWPWIPASVHVRDPWVDPQGWPVAARDNLASEGWQVLPAEFKAWFGDTGVVVQVHADGRHLGAVLMSFDQEFELDQVRAEFLAAAGHILGRAIHSGILARRLQELGALRERRLLADELHVDLAQQVAALGLHAGAMRLDFEEDDRPRLAADIAALTDMVMTLKVTLRHQMLALRTDPLGATDCCMGAVRAQVRAFEQLAPVQVVIECPDPDAAAAVPLDVTAQLTRVLQEALSNAHIHSMASRVVVRVLASDTRVRLEIEDCGRGFDPEAVPDTRLGMVIMKERMAQVGGQLTVQSSSGRGTVVIAEAPFGQPEGWIALTERIGTFT